MWSQTLISDNTEGVAVSLTALSIEYNMLIDKVLETYEMALKKVKKLQEANNAGDE